MATRPCLPRSGPLQAPLSSGPKGAPLHSVLSGDLVLKAHTEPGWRGPDRAPLAVWVMTHTGKRSESRAQATTRAPHTPPPRTCWLESASSQSRA